MTGAVTDGSSDTIRILHVDDEPDLAETAATFLAREDDRFSVETATDAEEGLDRLDEGQFDCVVSDYDMPGRNGIELLETVREEYPDLPFILYTGKGSEAVASEAISTGVTDYLQKERGTEQYTILANRIANSVAQYRAEQEVRTTQEYFGTILEHASDFVMIVDDSGRIDYISPAVERVLGYTPEELDGIDAFEHIHPEDLSVATAAFADVLENPGQDHAVEYRARHADESWRWIEVRGRNRLDDPVIEGIVVSAREITERKARERELSRTYEQMEFGLDATDSIIWVVDLETGEATNHGPVERLFGTEPTTMEAFFETVVHPEDRPAVERVFRAVQNGDTDEYDVEYRTNHATGAVKWIASTGYVQTDQSASQLIGLATDVTARKHRETELQRQNERLEQFTDILVHDLRNPLNVASGRLELLAENCDSEHLDAIERSHTRIETLIEDLLALAREGEAVTDSEPIALATIADECWTTVETGETTLVVESDRSIRADASRLRQLFENLFRNAVEHGGPDVTVTVGTLDDGFYVEDDGPGIPEDERDEVFETGYSTSEEGTGFGLNIAEQIVEAHGWEIRVVDGSGEGARFEVTGVEFGTDR